MGDIELGLSPRLGGKEPGTMSSTGSLPSVGGVAGGSMVPRAYQTECLELVKTQNTIVNMPTGSGKTLVAILAIDHFRRTYPQKKILFIAPTQALADQQADVCRRDSSTKPSVVTVYGQSIDAWDSERCGVFVPYWHPNR